MIKRLFLFGMVTAFMAFATGCSTFSDNTEKITDIRTSTEYTDLKASYIAFNTEWQASKMTYALPLRIKINRTLADTHEFYTGVSDGLPWEKNALVFNRTIRSYESAYVSIMDTEGISSKSKLRATLILNKIRSLEKLVASTGSTQTDQAMSVVIPVVMQILKGLAVKK